MLKRIKDSIFDILRQADWLLLCLCCGAALFGLVMIASATNFLNSWKMVIVQACAIVLGVGIYFLMSQIDLTEAAKRWKWLLGFGIVMFLLLKTPLGIENNGNRAWLGIQGFPANIQPAEIVKLTFILVLSRQLVWVKENWGLKSLRSIAFLAGHVLLMVGLYYVISSDMGSALVYIFIFAAMAFVAGVAARWFIIALLGGGAAFYLLWELDKIPDYMKERFMVVFDHDLDPLGAGWQQTRSLLALGGGKLTGQGLFHGIQTQGEYSGSLPFRYTDFIFSAIGEELGMLGCLAVLLLLAAIIAASISTADSQLLVASSSFTADLYKPFFRKNATEKETLMVGRILVLVLSAIAFLIANSKGSGAQAIMDMVENAWGAFGASFGPTILLSLFWRRFNYKGAVAGVVSGFVVDLGWLLTGLTASTGIFEIVPGFIASFIIAVIVAKCTAAPNAKAVEIFDKGTSKDAD